MIYMYNDDDDGVGMMIMRINLILIKEKNERPNLGMVKDYYI